MPNLNSVHNLNADAFQALKNVQNPEAMTAAEAETLKAAILKDGSVDAAETQLIERLTQQSPPPGSPILTGSTATENPVQIDVYAQGTAEADPESVQVARLSQEAADALDISVWDMTKAKANVAITFVENEVVQPIDTFVDENIIEPLDEHVIQPLNEHVVQPVVESVKRLINHVWQYDPSQGTRKENQANCGPASAAIVGENMGLEMPPLSQIRSSVGARRGNGAGAFALSTNQVIRAVEKQGEAQGQDIHGEAIPLSTDVDALLDEMRERLDKGEQLILLTSNIAIRSARSLASGSGKGHYVVVNEVRDDGSIMITDPQKRNGLEIEHSREHLETHLRRRRRFGRPNTLIAFENRSSVA